VEESATAASCVYFRDVEYVTTESVFPDLVPDLRRQAEERRLRVALDAEARQYGDHTAYNGNLLLHWHVLSALPIDIEQTILEPPNGTLLLPVVDTGFHILSCRSGFCRLLSRPHGG
jgi:hypothetical protein